MRTIEQENEHEPNIPLIISFSESSEFDRIRYTLNKLPWFQQHGYKLTFPKAIQKAIDLGSDIDDEATQDAVHEEFVSDRYQEQSEKLQKEWNENA